MQIFNRVINEDDENKVHFFPVKFTKLVQYFRAMILHVEFADFKRRLLTALKRQMLSKYRQAQIYFNRYFVLQSCVCPLFHHELGSLVRGFLGRYSFLYLGRPFGPLALCQCAPDIRRSILRIPETSYRTSRQDKPDPETNP
jgi:hypothetical protein